MSHKLSRDVVIINELGLHARSAAEIAKLAQNANSKVWLIMEKERVDASSIIDILSLGCSKGSKITLKIDEDSDVNILNEIVEIVKKGFGE
ncbi:MAG: HPr family phosphocarrier protein [Desulfobacterales bacterium]|nr:HPr family phosphocarrier protein [Desulfobacterales bacterium]